MSNFDQIHDNSFMADEMKTLSKYFSDIMTKDISHKHISILSVW